MREDGLKFRLGIKRRNHGGIYGYPTGQQPGKGPKHGGSARFCKIREKINRSN